MLKESIIVSDILHKKCVCQFLRNIIPLFFNSGPLDIIATLQPYRMRVARKAYIQESIFIHSCYHLKERRLHSRNRSQSGKERRRATGDAPSCAVSARMLPAQIIAAGKFSPPHHPPIRGGKISAKPEHPGQFDIAANTRCSTTIQDRLSARARRGFLAKISRLFFPFLFFSLRTCRKYIWRVYRSAKKKHVGLKKVVKIKVLESRRKGKFPDVFCARTADKRTFLARLPNAVGDLDNFRICGDFINVGDARQNSYVSLKKQTWRY